MKKTIILSLFIPLLSFGQDKVNFQLHGDFSHYLKKSFSYAYETYMAESIALGINVSSKKIDVNTLFFYNFMYSGIYKFNAIKDYTRLHQIGGKFEIIFLSNTKRFRPYLSLTSGTSLDRKYKNKLLDSEALVFIDKAEVDIHFLSKVQPNPITRYARFYQSTPFIGTFVTGCDVRIVENFHVKVGVGYGLQIMKTKYAEWSGGKTNNPINPYPPNMEAFLKDIPMDTHYFHLLDVQVGLSYSFPLKKKE